MLAKFTNTTRYSLTITAEGQECQVTPGSNVAADFTDDEWAAAEQTRKDAFAREITEHEEQVEKDKAWVKKTLADRDAARVKAEAESKERAEREAKERSEREAAAAEAKAADEKRFADAVRAAVAAELAKGRQP